jgi:hypothetical protein
LKLRTSSAPQEAEIDGAPKEQNDSAEVDPQKQLEAVCMEEEELESAQAEDSWQEAEAFRLLEASWRARDKGVKNSNSKVLEEKFYAIKGANGAKQQRVGRIILDIAALTRKMNQGR